MRTILLLFLGLAEMAFASDRDTLPGMRVSNALETPARIVIRCGAPVTPADQPLYVVDGVPCDFFEIGRLNPDEILRIEILKSSAASAIYGFRAMNGVVVITTKRSQHLVIQDGENENLLEGATVKILADKCLKQTMVLVADKNGEVDISPFENLKECSLQISCIGYKTKMLELAKNKWNHRVNMEKEYKLMNNITISTEDLVRRKTNCRSSFMRGGFLNPEQRPGSTAFSVYPNPARPSETLTIALSRTLCGTASLLNASGQVIQTTHLGGGNANPVIHMKAAAPGSYFVQVVDRQTLKTYTQKLIIQ